MIKYCTCGQTVRVEVHLRRGEWDVSYYRPDGSWIVDGVCPRCGVRWNCVDDLEFSEPRGEAFREAMLR